MLFVVLKVIKKIITPIDSDSFELDFRICPHINNDIVNRCLDFFYAIQAIELALFDRFAGHSMKNYRIYSRPNIVYKP